MENSSKALIIAGAILVAIILISVGIIVLNSINKPLNQASNEGDTLAAQIYNSKIKAYQGNKTADEVKSLFLLLKTTPEIIIDNTNTDSVTSEDDPKLVDGKHYSVSFTYAEASGKIVRVYIRALD